MIDLAGQRNQFYEILDRLTDRVGLQTLGGCTSGDGWPTWGVYFFFEDGEPRENGHPNRVVRIGTHAVSRGSKATLWKRLSTHRGTISTGGGNHRGSIFRRHVGIAMQRAGHVSPVCQTWGVGGSAPRDVRVQEHYLEVAVSDYIRSMPFVWVATGPDISERSIIERNTIALLSNYDSGRTDGDSPSKSWLGHHATHEEVRSSGLWNVKHVKDKYDQSFLDVFERCALSTAALEKASCP